MAVDPGGMAVLGVTGVCLAYFVWDEGQRVWRKGRELRQRHREELMGHPGESTNGTTTNGATHASTNHDNPDLVVIEDDGDLDIRPLVAEACQDEPVRPPVTLMGFSVVDRMARGPAVDPAPTTRTLTLAVLRDAVRLCRQAGCDAPAIRADAEQVGVVDDATMRELDRELRTSHGMAADADGLGGRIAAMRADLDRLGGLIGHDLGGDECSPV